MFGSIIILNGCLSLGTRLIVSCGLSLITVFAPTRMASNSFLKSWTLSKHSSEVNRLESVPKSSTDPFLSTASLIVTIGFLCLHQYKNPSICLAASSSNSPYSTSIPAFSSTLIPLPLTFGFGSLQAITTFSTPAHKRDSVHGGVLPKWLQGSKVTYAVAPFVDLPFSSAL